MVLLLLMGTITVVAHGNYYYCCSWELLVILLMRATDVAHENNDCCCLLNHWLMLKRQYRITYQHSGSLMLYDYWTIIILYSLFYATYLPFYLQFLRYNVSIYHSPKQEILASMYQCTDRWISFNETKIKYQIRNYK